MSKIAPPPLSELESWNLFAYGQFFTIDPPLSSTCKLCHSRPSPEVPIVIGRKIFTIGYRNLPLPPLAPLLSLLPTLPSLHHKPRPFKIPELTLDPLSHRNDNISAEEALQYTRRCRVSVIEMGGRVIITHHWLLLVDCYFYDSHVVWTYWREVYIVYPLRG